jgi:hypothetical protein
MLSLCVETIATTSYDWQLANRDYSFALVGIRWPERYATKHCAPHNRTTRGGSHNNIFPRMEILLKWEKSALNYY